MAAKKVEPAEGIAQTVIPGDLPEPAKSVSFTDPWGTKVTIDADLAETFKDAGYKVSK